MNKRWMWVLCLLALGGLLAGSTALFAKEDEDEAGVSGSIVVPSDEAMLAKLAKVSLVEAIGSAVKNTPGAAVSAELEEEDGFLVYEVKVAAGDKVTEVTVDAGNKKILKTEAKEGDDDEGEGEGEGHEHGGCKWKEWHKHGHEDKE